MIARRGRTLAAVAALVTASCSLCVAVFAQTPPPPGTIPVPGATPISPVLTTPTPPAGVAPVGAPPPPQSVPSSAASTPPIVPGSTAAPTAGLIRFTGQLLDYRSGYAFFTTGDGFHVAPNVKIVDAKTGQPDAEIPAVKMFARATFDGTGTIVELALSRARLAPEAAYGDVAHFAVALSPAVTNPDLAPAKGGTGLSGRPPTGRAVAVTFIAQVPPATPFSDAVYIATDTSGWNPEAIRLDRIDALHYRVTRTFASGTRFNYRYTRGSWPTEERGENGLENDPRAFVVSEADALRKNDIVYHWADETGAGREAGPNAIPTPFNPNPFPFATPTPLNGPALPQAPTLPATGRPGTPGAPGTRPNEPVLGPR